jgi:hypothetical protein
MNRKTLTNELVKVAKVLVGKEDKDVEKFRRIKSGKNFLVATFYLVDGFSNKHTFYVWFKYREEMTEDSVDFHWQLVGPAGIPGAFSNLQAKWVPKMEPIVMDEDMFSDMVAAYKKKNADGVLKALKHGHNVIMMVKQMIDSSLEKYLRHEVKVI